MKPMVFMGIDIGFDRCGYCFIKYDIQNKSKEIIAGGCITTDKNLPISKRLKILLDDLSSLKNTYSPEYVSIEKLFFYRRNPTFEKVCMAKGVALCLLSDLQLLEIEPSKLKLYLTGSGASKKSEIRPFVEKLLQKDLSGFYDDTIDAIGLALFHIDMVRLELMIQK